MIQFQVRFLQGVAVKRVVVRRGNPRLGEDFLPYRYLSATHGWDGSTRVVLWLLKSIDDNT